MLNVKNHKNVLESGLLFIDIHNYCYGVKDNYARVWGSLQANLVRVK